MSLYKIIQALASTRSSNVKKEILTRNIDNEDLKTFFRLALSNKINFYQKQAFQPNEAVIDGYPSKPITEAMAWLENVIASRKITGNAAYAAIDQLLENCTADNQEIIKLILQKKSGCDLGASIINKIWPKLIPEFPCLLATNYDEKLAGKLNWKKGVYSQKKSDGLRLALVLDAEGSVTAYTRAGNELDMHGRFDVLGNYFRNCVIDGELLTINPVTGKFNDRQTSNGICSRAIHGTMTKEQSEMLHMTVWDFIDLEDFYAGYSSVIYQDRLGTLECQVGGIPIDQHKKLLSIIPSRIVHSIAEAQEHYQEMIDAKEEGTVIKDQDMLWEDKRSKKQLKLKSEYTGDVKVVGWLPGEGKLVGNLGALSVATECDKVQVNMSGFSLKLRSEIFANIVNGPVEYAVVEGDKLIIKVAMPGDCGINIGSILEIMYNGKIKARDSDVWSLFLPRFSKDRPDKTKANTMEELK